MSSGPTTELGAVHDTGHIRMPGVGGTPGWTTFVDEREWVPELVWPNSVRVYEQMRTDSQLSALYLGATLPIRRYRWLIDPNGAQDKIVNAVAQDFNLDIKGKDPAPRRRTKGRFSHYSHLKNVLEALIFGFAFFEQFGQIEDDGKWHIRKLAPRPQHTIAEIKVAEDGGLISIKQNVGVNRRRRGGVPFWPMDQPEIPVDRLVAYPWDMTPGNWTGRSIFRDCYKNWLVKDRLLRIDAINHERAGGVPYVEASENTTPTEMRRLNTIASKFKIGESSGAALPYGSKLHIAKGTGSDVVASIKYHDESMARRFLMMFIQLGQTQTGSRALGQEFIDFVDLAQESIANWYCDITNEHVIEDWVDWNYGEQEDFVPLITYQKEDNVALSVEDLVALVDKNIVTVDEELEQALRAQKGLPRLAPGTRTKVMTPPAPDDDDPDQEPQSQPSQVVAGSGEAADVAARAGSGAPSRPSLATTDEVIGVA